MRINVSSLACLSVVRVPRLSRGIHLASLDHEVNVSSPENGVSSLVPMLDEGTQGGPLALVQDRAELHARRPGSSHDQQFVHVRLPGLFAFQLPRLSQEQLGSRRSLVVLQSHGHFTKLDGPRDNRPLLEDPRIFPGPCVQNQLLAREHREQRLAE